MYKRGMLTLALLLLAGGAAPASALAATEISGDIEGDALWTLSGSPYQIVADTNFSVIEPGATLAIEPGVTVEFAPGTRLNIFGNLLARGTADKPIVFTTSSGSDGWTVNIFDSPGSEFSNFKADHSPGRIATYDSAAAINQLSLQGELMFFDSLVDIDTLDFSGTSNLLVSGGSIALYGAIVNGHGISIYDAPAHLQNIAITNAVSASALMLSGGNATLENITINNARNGINATQVPHLVARGVAIKNISDQNGLIFSGETADLAGISIENIPYGAGLQGSEINLRDFHISQVQQAPALQINADTISMVDSTFMNGLNTGVSINGNEATLQNVAISGFSRAPAFLPNAQLLHGDKLILTDNLIGVYNSSASSTIRRSMIASSTVAGVINASEEIMDARHNYWGHPAGPTLGHPSDPSVTLLGDSIMGDILYEPFLAEFCETDCHSNIMFLPGIMASRLYENGEQLWEPGVFTRDSEFEALYLDESGNSINSIYTKDVLDNGHAYGKLIADLNSLKAAGTINDYAAVPYDWRLSMEDVLNTGTKREDGTIIYDSAVDEPYIESTLRRLAANSKSGKVTIIAHSNGGLLTKALINELGGEAAELIDKIILVAVPQLGTPQAIGALLHGYNAGQPTIYPFILSPERARDLAINMPMIYQLMPFADYYNNEGANIDTPYITFEDGAATQAFIDRYGYAITPDELADFLSGAEGRAAAPYDDLEKPTNANATLLAEAQSLQQTIDSSWFAPAGIEVHQIAGIGEDTLAGITYKTIQKCAERTIIFTCSRYEDVLSYKPNTVMDGDGTVVVPSAMAMSNNADRWWFDLDDYNPILFPYKHADILEIDELRKFIFENLITRTSDVVPEYVSMTVPNIEQNDRLVFTLHSPLALSAIDEDGNVISEQISSITGATYTRYGEVQVITIPTGIKFTLILTGEAEGSFTLEMEQFDGDELVDSSVFSAIPSSTSTLATITFTDDSLEDAGKLEVDYNGDSIVDLTYTPILGKTVTTPDDHVIAAVERIVSGGSSGSHPIGRVLGVADNTLTLEQLTQIVNQLHIVVTALSHLKGKTPESQYDTISSQVFTMLSTLEQLLSAQK